MNIDITTNKKEDFEADFRRETTVCFCFQKRSAIFPPPRGVSIMRPL